MQRSCARLVGVAFSLATTRGFCTANVDNIVASVIFERLPIIVPKMDPAVYAFQEFSFRWRNQFRRAYPDQFLDRSEERAKGEFKVPDYEPAPRISEADKTNDRRSLNRALDRKVFLLLYGTTWGSPDDPVWHFPEKVYEGEKTMRKCAESALESVLGDLSRTYFVGNAPCGHLPMQPKENELDITPLTRFFFKSQVVNTFKFNVKKCEDYLWLTKDELLKHFPEQTEFLKKLVIDTSLLSSPNYLKS